jgi:outer membrane lipoprotein-sorting protein
MRFTLPSPLVVTAIVLTVPAPFWGAETDCTQPALLSDSEIGDRISEAESQRDNNLLEYSVVRKYVLENSHLKQPAVMTVRLTFRKGQGKSFDVIDLQNAEGMSRRVLQKIVDSEAETSRKECTQHRDDLEVTNANYDFHVVGTEYKEGRRCYVVTLIPKCKSKYLVQGKAWVDAEDFAIIRIEGRPAANLSFWVGKPYIVQEFQKVGQFWMASRNRSQSQSMVLGSSVLTIEYSGYQVNNPEMRVAQNQTAAPKRPSIE